MTRIFLLIIVVFSLMFLSCEKSTTESNSGTSEIEQNEDKIFIVDQQRNKWDITAAVQIYGMEAQKFKAGLGPNIIKPINDPVFIGPGDHGYPKNSDDFLMIGANFSGDRRAYPIAVINDHEVVNDVFLDQHVAITY